eukprot:4724539-Pleurochrysis_carterae.AAC.1
MSPMRVHRYCFPSTPGISSVHGRAFTRSLACRCTCHEQPLSTMRTTLRSPGARQRPRLSPCRLRWEAYNARACVRRVLQQGSTRFDRSEATASSRSLVRRSPVAAWRDAQDSARRIRARAKCASASKHEAYRQSCSSLSASIRRAPTRTPPVANAAQNRIVALNKGALGRP